MDSVKELLNSIDNKRFIDSNHSTQDYILAEIAVQLKRIADKSCEVVNYSTDIIYKGSPDLRVVAR